MASESGLCLHLEVNQKLVCSSYDDLRVALMLNLKSRGEGGYNSAYLRGGVQLCLFEVTQYCLIGVGCRK